MLIHAFHIFISLFININKKANWYKNILIDLLICISFFTINKTGFPDSVFAQGYAQTGKSWNNNGGRPSFYGLPVEAKLYAKTEPGNPAKESLRKNKQQLTYMLLKVTAKLWF